MGITQNRDKDAILRVAQTAAAEWGFTPDLKELGDCENLVYKATDKNGTPFIVRVTEPIHRSIKEIEAELDYVDFLKSEGLGVCASLKNPKTGMRIETYTDDVTQNSYHVCVTEFAAGGVLNLEKHWDEDLPRRLGQLLANLKKASLKYDSDLSERHVYFEDDHVKNALHYIPQNHTLARQEWTLAIEWAKSLPQSPQHFGLCHTDIHAANFFIDDSGNITVFDFDDTCMNFYLYDAMIPCIIDVLKNDNLSSPTADEYRRIYLTAYASELGITDVARLDKDIRNFERLRDIEMYAWVYMMGYDKEQDMEKWQKQFKPDQPFL